MPCQFRPPSNNIDIADAVTHGAMPTGTRRGDQALAEIHFAERDRVAGCALSELAASLFSGAVSK
jgi:hypothetical protein